MSSFRKKKSSQVRVPQPSPPPNFFNFEGDFLRSSSQFDPTKNAFNVQTFSRPQELAREQQLGQLFSNAFSQLAQTPEQRTKQLEEFENSFLNKLSQPLNEAFETSSKRAKENFNASGFLNSTGFEDFRVNQLEKLRQQGLTDAAERGDFGS